MYLSDLFFYCKYIFSNTILFLQLVLGYIIVWSGNLNGQICDSQRYQPIRYFNSDGSDCILRKSVCNEEGQIIVEDGSPISDRRCRCDYRRGYSFVSEPKNKCTCIPSIEDCSCYFKHCPKYQEVSPG